MGTSYSPNIVKDGLVFYVDPANPRSYVSGSLDTFNLKNTTITGSLKNETGFVGLPTASFIFDGTDDYINCGAVSSIPSATELSVSFWANTDSTSENQVVFGDNSATPIFSFEYWGSNNRMYFEYGSSLYAYLTLTSVVTAGSWHNVILVYNGGGSSDTDKIKIYIDGVDKSSSMTYVGTIPASLNASIGDFWIGNGQKYNVPFNGKIANVQIYNRALSAQEVKQNYNALKRRFI